MALKRLVPIRAAVLLALSCRAACADAPPPAPAHRVVVVSFDGAGGLDFGRRLASGFFSTNGFARAAREGESASRMEIVVPSLTAVSHIALATGMPPSRTGIVGNTFHPAGAPLLERGRGFDVEPETETLWEAARRQGKRVASLSFPGASQRTPRSTTDLSLHYNETFQKSTFWTGPPTGVSYAEAQALPDGVVSFSPARTLEIQGRSFLLLDSTDDGAIDYDTLAVRGKDGRVASRARAGEWFALAESRPDGNGEETLSGRWCKVLSLSPDLSSLSIYFGDTFRTEASPPEFRRAVEARVGFWPGLPDAKFLKGPQPDIASFLEQARRLTSFFVGAFEVAETRSDWDLLLAYIPILDACEHNLLVTDPAQPFYTKERAARSAAAIDDAWRAADEAAARFLKFEALGDVFFVSDHGMRAMTGSVYPAAILARAGLLQVAAPASTSAGARTQTSPSSPLEFVYASGGTGFVVANRASLPGGFLDDAAADAVVARAAAALRGTRDESGRAVFAVVANRAEAAALGVSHPNMGDLLLIAAGSRHMRSGLPEGGSLAPLGPPEIPGQHGFDADPALDGLFLHVGKGVARARLGIIRELDVAARIAARLGIAPPGLPRPGLTP